MGKLAMPAVWLEFIFITKTIVYQHAVDSV
jgi:hypothetical protein